MKDVLLEIMFRILTLKVMVCSGTTPRL